MNLLFLGGNRYFGKAVLTRLLKKNFNIYLVNRNTKKEIIKHQNLVHISCDRKELTKYEDILKNVTFDHVVDNIAYNLEDVKYLFKILNNKIKHYIFTSSSITYLGLNDKVEVKEKDWPKGRINKSMIKKYNKKDIRYALNKRKIEKFLIGNKKINSTILRFPNVVGKNDFSNKTQKLLDYPFGKINNPDISEDDYIQFIFKEDLVKAIIKVIEIKLKKTDTFNIANEKIKIKDFYKKLYNHRKLLFKKKKFLLYRKFPLPVNSLLNCKKIEKKINIKFSSINKILNLIN
tara:strand:- start:26 stop:895 length:870 start_codon:yes stop_codon:yes gene_type:complete